MAFEVFHHMKRMNAKKRGNMAIKLDMSKVYDRIEWDYLEHIMRRMGFSDRWIDRIMTCVSTVTYSFLVNGKPTEIVTPHRGLRQGDPISPYLFLLCVEGLGAMLQQAQEQQRIHGISVARGAPSITHLFFADDSIIFVRANDREASVIADILRRYEGLSGQKVNLDKCEISFSNNLESNVRETTKARLGMREVEWHDKYLGLPTLLGRSKKISFASIIDRIWKKLQGWKEKLLSRAGKEVLIKAVAQAIPSYAMSCFKLPTTFCHEIESIINKFWWGNAGGKNGIHWKNWCSMCRPKLEGGLGFRNFEAFNEALLAKQLWRLHQQPYSLLTRIYKARYYPHACLWKVEQGVAPSYAWRSILGARKLLLKGVRWRVGNGRSINIWWDRWIGGAGSGYVITPRRLLHENACVSTLIDENNGYWRDDLIKEVFFAVDYE